MRRCTPLRRRLTLLLAVVFWPVAARSAEPALNPELRSFLDSHCVSCHDAAVKKGGLDLEALSAEFTNPSVFGKWVKVHDRLRAGEMPPRERKKRPTATATEAALKILNADLSNAELGGVDFRDLWHRAASYVDKVLKGAQPGDLPVELPTKFAMAINTRTAKTVGLTIPPSLLVRADRILE